MNKFIKKNILRECLRLLFRSGARLWVVVNSILLPYSILLVTGCDSGPTSPDGKAYLTFIDVSAQEVFLHIRVATIQGDQSIELIRDGIVIETFSPAITDTIITDGSLAPNTSYRYQVVIRNGNEAVSRSNEIQAHTLIPSSHDFSFTTFYFGDGNISSLSGVWIIDENNFWTVGEFYYKDSTGQFLNPPYNLIKYSNGNWDKFRVTVNILGNWLTPGLHGIRIYSGSNIWFTSTYPIKGNGDAWTLYHLHSMGINASATALWGKSSSDLFFCGVDGSIVHYDGKSFVKIESGTNTYIGDLCGYMNPINGKDEVLFAASSFWERDEEQILKLSDNAKIESIAWGQGRDVFSIWTQNGFPIYTAGEGVFSNKIGFWKEETPVDIYSQCIRGNNLADIVTVGGYGHIDHYNGINWKVFQDASSANYYSVAIKNNLLIAVGEKNGRGVLTIGRRY